MVRMAFIRKKLKTVSAGEDVQEMEHSDSVDENAN